MNGTGSDDWLLEKTCPSSFKSTKAVIMALLRTLEIRPDGKVNIRVAAIIAFPSDQSC